MNSKPLVSIIVPVYNGSNFMREAIDSALAQTYDNIEIIVVNDGSTDNTDEIALSYGDKIRYFQKENGGVSSALNLGIMKMKGEYFSWLSHDDKYFPNKIENQINLLAKTNNLRNIAYCDSVRINEKGDMLFRSKRNKYLKPGTNSWEESLTALIKNGCLSGCAFLIPKDAFFDAGFFDEKLKYSQDFLMWINILLKHYAVVYEPSDGVYIRVHDKQMTNTGSSLFYHDSSVLASLVVDSLSTNSSKHYNFTYYLAVYFAKHLCRDAISIIIRENCLTFWQKISIFFISLYGKIRPILKKIYLKTIRKERG